MSNLKGFFNGEQIFIPTGWPSLDASMNGGLLRGTLTALAARPGTGTSVLVINLCINFAAYGHPCLFLTHDGERLCVAKMLAAVSSTFISIDDALHQIETGNIDETLSTAADELDKLNIGIKNITPFIDEQLGVIEKFARDNSRCSKPLVIVIDGIDDFNGYTLNRLKDCASVYDAVVVVTVHNFLDRDDLCSWVGVAMEEVLNSCDTVLLVEKDSLDLKLSICKCRYSKVHQAQDAVLLTPFFKWANVFELSYEEDDS